MDLQGTQNADTLTGGADSDTIYGFGGNDTLKGLAGDDVLAGHDGNDTLLGGAGDDYLLGGAGNDTIDGGDGNDWAAYEDATAGVKVDLNLTGAQNTGGGGTDKLTGIENVYGSSFNDTLTGNADHNMLVGDAGNDIISGGKGDDTLWGDAGNDTLDGGDGDDYMVGGAGDDVIKGGAGVDWSSYENATAGVTVDLNKTTAQNTGGAGTDTITGVELLYGSKFDDVLTGDAKDNYLWGSDGNDKLYGGAGDDHLSGGNGVNLIDGGAGFDTVDYAFSDKGVTINLSGAPAPQIPIPDGVDTIISVEAAMGSAYNDYIVGNDAENYLFGDAGDDVIFGIGGHDTLDGGDGNDVLRGSYRKPGDMLLGGAGNDQIIVWTGAGSEGDATIVDGGAGVDSLMFSSVSDITLNLANTGDQVIAPGVHMVVSNIENVRGSYGADHLTGDAGNNVINGEAGNDALDGGAGFDIASYEGDKSVRVDLSKTGPQDTGGAGIDTLSNFEGLRGSLKADILIGDAKDNTLEGGLGDDIMDGGAGSDTAIFIGNANQYTWSRNANGTWTVKGLEGADTLLNIETLKFADKSVTLTPSTTTVTVDDLVNPQALVSVASTSTFVSSVMTRDGGTVYVSDAAGYVSAVNTMTGAVSGHWKVGDQLRGMDLSADGRYIVVAEGAFTAETGASGERISTVKAHVLDLQTGAVKTFVTTTPTYVGTDFLGFYDAAFMSDGKIVLSQESTGLPHNSPMSLDPATGVFTRLSTIEMPNATISVSDDHQEILLSRPGVTSAPLIVVAAGQGQTAWHGEYNDGVSGSNMGIQAISGDGSRIAQALTWGKIHIYDQALKHLSLLETERFGVSTPYGMDFSADGKKLYLVDGLTNRVLEFSTNTGALERTLSLGFEIDTKVGVGFGDSVHLSDDGGRLVILSGSHVYAVGLAGLADSGATSGGDVLKGGDGADRMWGLGGDDTMIGGAGNDLLIGGFGKDILTGGAGSDTFAFGAYDTTAWGNTDSGVDVITDWEVADKLMFGSTGATVALGKQTAASWNAAAATAPQTMGAQNLTHLAVQVGSDVYVFAGSGGMFADNAVKLVNTSLDKISAANFVLNTGSVMSGNDGDDRFFGGGGNDLIHGAAGNDNIEGAQGADTLTGGTGIDTFVFEAGDTSWSPTSDAGVDVITDWEAGDKLSFAPLGSGFVLSKLVLNSWAEALTEASRPGGSPGQSFMAFQVGADVYVFYAPNGTTSVVENVVKLANTTLDKVGLTTFIPHIGLPVDGDDNANVLTGSVLADEINGKGGNDVINGGKGNDTLTGGAGADVFKFLAGDGSFSLQAGSPLFSRADVITDFGAGDKLAFSSAAATVTASDILNLGHWDATPGANPISTAMELALYAQAQQYEYGAVSQKYMVFGVGADTYVLADNDVTHMGYDQVVLLKNFSSTLVTADMFLPG